MRPNKLKMIVTTGFAVFAAIAAVGYSGPEMSASAQTDEIKASYKKNCMACHLPKADKFFDVAKTDEEHVEIIMKGKKGEKPPFMPGYEAKGMKTEEATALAAYMRQLRTPAN